MIPFGPIAASSTSAVSTGGGVISVSVAQATSTHTALAVGKAKKKTLGLGTITNTALAVTVRKGKLIGIGLAGETDFPLAVTRQDRRIGLASETDSALHADYSKPVGVIILPANAVWPTGLPEKVLVDGFQESFPDPTIRTQMDAGPGKARRRHTAAPRPLKCRIAMTEAQRVVFDDFWNLTLGGGALPFDWVHPITEDAASFRFLSKPILSYHSSGACIFAELDLEILPGTP